LQVVFITNVKEQPDSLHYSISESFSVFPDSYFLQQGGIQACGSPAGVARRRRYFAHSSQWYVLSIVEIRRQFFATARDSAANDNRCIFSHSPVCSTNTVHGSSDNNSLPNSTGELSAARVLQPTTQLSS